MITVPAIETIADLMRRLGDVPLDRVRFRPPPGTATVRDVEETRQREGRLCELVEGVLLEKAVGYLESRLAVFLAGLLNAFVIPRNLGVVTGSDGTVELLPDLIRIPDVAFTRWDRLPSGAPLASAPRVAPNLAVEVLSTSNTPGEMNAKRRDYFAAGVEVVWEIDPRGRQVTVYGAAGDSAVLRPGDVLEGAPALVGFRLPVQDLFAELDRHG
jgi:Uma2 family endonuclease